MFAPVREEVGRMDPIIVAYFLIARLHYLPHSPNKETYVHISNSNVASRNRV